MTVKNIIFFLPIVVNDYMLFLGGDYILNFRLQMYNLFEKLNIISVSLPTSTYSTISFKQYYESFLNNSW